MRDRGGAIFLVAVVIALVAVGVHLAMRGEPEPSVPREARRRAAPPREPQVEVRTEAEPSGSVPETDGPAPVAERETEGEAPAGCDHAFVPFAPGAWRRYVWRSSDQERSAELRIEAASARELPDGERELTWRVRVTAEDDASELAEQEMTTRCAPGVAAEEPWFGILERSLGLRLTGGRGRWRWPARLRAGARFDGTAVFDTREAEMRVPDGAGRTDTLRVSREHVVGSRERVDAPAGRFGAWRVDYREEHAFGPRGESGTGTVWVAPEIGMIRSRAENSRGVVQTIELVAFGPR